MFDSVECAKIDKSGQRTCSAEKECETAHLNFRTLVTSTSFSVLVFSVTVLPRLLCACASDRDRDPLSVWLKKPIHSKNMTHIFFDAFVRIPGHVSKFQDCTQETCLSIILCFNFGPTYCSILVSNLRFSVEISQEDWEGCAGSKINFLKK